MKSLLAVLLLATTPLAYADTWLTASLVSYHVERGRQYCEVNPGVGIEHGDRLRFVAGTYHNSLCQTSNYVGLSLTVAKFGDFRLGAAALAITGYEKSKRGSESVAALLPIIAYERDKWGLNVIVIPPYDDFKGAVGVQAKVRF